MLNLADIERVHLACGSTNMRKSIDGLAALVSQVFHLDPFAPSLFVFCNRRRDKLKILYWDMNGFWLLYRRLECRRFKWPHLLNGETLTVDRRQLQWLLDGLALEQKKAHSAVFARLIIIVKTFLAAGGDWLHRANSKGMKQYADVPKKDLARQCDILQQ